MKTPFLYLCRQRLVFNFLFFFINQLIAEFVFEFVQE